MRCNEEMGGKEEKGLIGEQKKLSELENRKITCLGIGARGERG